MKFKEDMGEMPLDCTGIELIDSTKDFGPNNCRWVNSKTRTRKKGAGKQILLSFWIDKTFYEDLQDHVSSISKKEGKSANISEYLRQVVRKSFPQRKSED